ncbi:hypothetical protein PMKS-001700 [Pichia membranifaciens]|uniref:Uncharacterized protein n=1 Tax=Pichia membranifaciens TaxID=4926 RepID=A0A1Q2YF78_9ASCO|nr:hypothetical protein PMKS-001700 [Pichia membranifaciens]
MPSDVIEQRGQTGEGGALERAEAGDPGGVHVVRHEQRRVPRLPRVEGSAAGAGLRHEQEGGARGDRGIRH